MYIWCTSSRYFQNRNLYSSLPKTLPNNFIISSQTLIFLSLFWGNPIGQIFSWFDCLILSFLPIWHFTLFSGKFQPFCKSIILAIMSTHYLITSFFIILSCFMEALYSFNYVSNYVNYNLVLLQLLWSIACTVSNS
jgi:hypothetical protein